MVSDDQPEAREGQAGRPGVAERFVVPRKPVTPVEGRDLSPRQTQYVVKDLETYRNLLNLSADRNVLLDVPQAADLDAALLHIS